MRTKAFIIILLLLLGGEIKTVAQENHWQCDIYAYEYDMAVYFTIEYNGEAVANPENYELAAFCNNECRGVGEIQTVTLADESSVSYGYIRIRSNQATGETISLMLYDKTLDWEFHVAETLVFKAQDLIGLPSSPTVFSVNITEGDINMNGQIDIGDAVCIVNYLVGKPNVVFNAEAADLNGNGQIDIGDAVCIVNIIVGKDNNNTAAPALDMENVRVERDPD